MAKSKMKDMIVLLPGIMGSVLQRNGKDLWAISGRSVFDFIKTGGSSLDNLVLGHDDPEVDDPGDNIKATALLPDANLIPGLWKIDGYSGIARMILNNFDVTRGSLTDQGPANYYEFPYDWRRDNRVAARQLKTFIERQLPVWRASSGAANAKVIILAHSMGGLVARHYLEMLEGWPNCRMLVTFGTPYRGSVKALNYLANGYKNVLVDLTEAVRSFTSLYQLLPIYPVVKTDGDYKRIVDLTNVPNLVRERAVAARKFHLDIIDKVSAHTKDTAISYNKDFQLIPIVGIRQPTLQSGELGQKLVTGETLPSSTGYLEAGDGTVPYTSAVPYEFSNQFREFTFIEQHGALQNNDRVLEYLANLLRRTQAGSLLESLGPEEEVAGIRLSVQDLYLPDEPVEIRANIVTVSDENNTDIPGPESLIATITSVEQPNLPIQREFRFTGENWLLTENALPPGLYRVEVKADEFSASPINPVHGLFEVLGNTSN